MSKDFHLIINPGRYPWFSRQLKKLMRYIQGATIKESVSAQDFQNKISDFVKSDAPYLLIWGGDGTANLALNTLMKEADSTRRKTLAVGFLRGGSGNGIQDSYEVPKGLSAQVKCYLDSMEKHLTQRVDLLKVEYDGKMSYGQLFGTGLDAQVLQSRNNNRRALGDKAPRPGFIPYLIPTVSTLWNHAKLLKEPQSLMMKRGRFAFRGTRTNAEFPFEEYGIETRAPLIELGVRPYFGWYYKICPDVVCNDGYFDAYLFNITNPMRIPFQLFFLWNGHYHRINHWNARKGLPLIEHYKISGMDIHARQGRLFHIDGELKQSDHEVRISVEPKALRFLVPRSFQEKFHPIHLRG